jgi:hypothetical protein
MRYGGSVYDSTEHSARWTRDVEVATADAFVLLLKASAVQRLANKRDGTLLCASFINGGRRSYENALGASGIWFDVDGKEGVLPPERWRELLPATRFVVVNTFSHTAGLPKYRVWIPLTRMVTPSDYKAAWQTVYSEVTAEGAVGIDTAPSSPISLFFLPCLPHSGESVWIDHDGDPLDPDPLVRRWHALEAVRERLARERSLLRPLPKASVADVEAALMKIPPDDRNTWFRIACALFHEYGEEGRLLWDVWSQGSPKYDRADQEKTWRSIRTKRVSKPITLGTVFAMARDGG